VIPLIFFAFFILTGSCPGQTAWEKCASNPVLNIGQRGDWDSKQVVMPAVIADSGAYRMWYSGFDGETWRIGSAQSPDGIDWTRDPQNPVFEPDPASSWDNNSVYGASVILDNGTYKMWYTGGNGKVARIGYATSPDGITWTRHTRSPVLSTGDPGSWDNASVYYPCVIRVGNKYRMWFNGYRGDLDTQVGYAESDDGIAWTKHAGSPVLGPGKRLSFDAVLVKPAVVFDGAAYHLWYVGFRYVLPELGFWNILYATSTDGLQWAKHPDNPVLKHGPRLFTGWDGRSVFDPAVILDGSEYKMWYAGQGGWGKAERLRIGHATSPAEPGAAQ
jgi:predicted GH43/DUF377 family glycosyl hydrolase